MSNCLKNQRLMIFYFFELMLNLIKMHLLSFIHINPDLLGVLLTSPEQFFQLEVLIL